ncbi:MAG: DUF354 domain-containing protein, partial [Candidatus Hadarchaeum sp.]
MSAVNNKKTIWIDLDNSPHVPFFRPVIENLKHRGYETILTARNCFQTCGLADLYGMKYTVIGRHYGRNKLLKVAGTLIRAARLSLFANRRNPALALSHGSRSQVLAGWFLGIPTMLIFDYEHTQGLGFIKAQWGVAPEVVIKEKAPKNARRLLSYPGIKEDVYVSDFKPDPQVLRDLDLKDKDFVVTIRPPATEAHYHNPESETLFIEVVNLLGQKDDIRIVILPRNEVRQTQFIRQHWSKWCDSGRIIIPGKVINGLDLIWFSDFVVSGGGTMNREAAALGVPV